MKRIVSAVMLSSCLVFNAVAGVAIVVHPDNNATITDENIKRIFLGKEKRFSDGQQSAPVNLKEGESKDEFNQAFLARSSSQVSAYWSKLIFTGKGTPPQEFASEQEVLTHVASNKDAIGYVNASLVNGSVKVIKTL